MNLSFIKRKDLAASFFIGLATAFIFLAIRGWLELPVLLEDSIIYFPFVLPLLAVLGTVVAARVGVRWPTLFQMSKNILVGILNSSIDIGLLNLLMFLSGLTGGWALFFFKAFSFSGASLNSYVWNKFWTFEDRERVEAGEMAKFYGVALGGLGIHEITINVVVNLVGPRFGVTPGLWTNVGNLLAIFLGFFWDFFGYKLLVFKR